MIVAYDSAPEGRGANAHVPEAPAYRPDQLLGARHDTPDQTGPLTGWEPVTDRAPAPEAATPPACPCECHGRTLGGLHGCCAASVPEERDALAARLAEAERIHALLLEEILRNADDDIKDADEAPEYLAEAWVRFLESEVARLRGEATP